MCGIAGLVHFDGRPVDEAVLRQMCQAMRHRGPDDEGWICWPRGTAQPGRASAGLGNRRLSVIDLAGGHQPIPNETKDIWAVLNGEIYNFAAVRAVLETRGHTFATRCDTEVIVHAYEEYGDACVEHLDGMFAFAIWDGPRERLLLARDRFGKKPLCYRSSGADFAFASELQALMPAVPAGRRDVDPDALGDYLAYMAIPAPRTIYRDIHKLPPAHTLVVDAHGTHLRQYWTLTYEPKHRVDETAAVERVGQLIEDAVRKRLVSEVPLGAFLSGGVDSSVVVGLMATLSDRPVKTFSIGFDDPRYNELPHARRVAEACHTEHHEFIVRPAVGDILPAMARHFGEPFADSSAVPSWYLSKLTREHVTVALNGDGGDEVFAGYGRHRANALAERWRRMPGVLRRSGARLAGAPVLAALGGARAARFSAAADLSRAARYRAWAGVFSADLVRELSSIATPDDDVMRDAFDAVSTLDAVDAMLAVDTRVYLPTDLLPKMDITSMAHSLELRSPLLDHALAEYVATLPTSLKLRGSTTKYLLKKAAAGIVPGANLHRRKQGFAVPIAHWLRHDLRESVCDYLRPSRVAQAGWIEQPVIDHILDAHLSGTSDYAHHLWVLLMLEVWYRTCLQT
jgi:asparagine synthase (glutamine-hydrolysing)